MGDDDFKYDDHEFIVFSIVTMFALVLALVIVIYDLINHARSDYSWYRKRPLLIMFVHEIAAILIIFGGLWTYSYADPYFIAVDILVSIAFLSFYFYAKETLMMLLAKHFEENPDSVKELVKEEENSQLFTSQVYPFEGVS